MIQVQLKAKHLYFIANILKNIVAAQFFSLLNRMKTATTGKQDDETVTVLVTAADLIYIYRILSSKPEGQANMINTEMNEMLLPQIVAGAQSGNADWIAVATEVPAIRQANWDITANEIIDGKTFLSA
jgi:hypothetical protein